METENQEPKQKREKLKDGKVKVRAKAGFATPGTRGTAIEITGVLADRITGRGRKIALDKAERKHFSRQRLIERLVALYLDVENHRSVTEIARELGVSVPTIRDITATEEFHAAYDLYFHELGHDPSMKATIQAVRDLAPLAYTNIRRLLSSPDTPPAVRLAASKEILRLAGADTPSKTNSKSEVAEFLKGMNVTQINVSVPENFQKKMDEVVDSEFSDASRETDERP